MTNHLLTDKMLELTSAWEEFKTTNDISNKEKAKHGAADPLTLDKLEKLNHAIDELSNAQTAMQRPSSEIKPIISDTFVNEHTKAFCHYVRKGIDNELSTLEKKSLSATVDVDGGFLVTRRMSDHIIKTIADSSPMRSIASIIQISTEVLEMIEDRDEAFAGWTLELEKREDTKTPQLGKKVIPAHELYAQPKATQKLIDDAFIDIETWIAEKLIKVFTRQENAAFINGDGLGKPRGILSYATGKNWGEIEQLASGENATITANSIFELYFSLKEAYAVNAKFLMSRQAV